MPIDRRNLKKNLVCAWKEALKRGADVDDNRCRAKIWVNAVADCFCANYSGKHDRVFWRWRDNETRRKEFKKNELLFDIMVCSIDTIDSFQSPSRPLPFIAKCYWQVESELNNKDTREIVIDMSKLVAGSAAHKLMIAAHPKTAGNGKKNDCALLNRFAKIAAACCVGEGKVYFCFVDHPREWASCPKGPALYEYTAAGWKELR